jgi:triosephosphate isomerase
MLVQAQCQYVIVGHSERRQHNGEDSALVNAKAQATILNGLTPIICVGEPLEAYEAGHTLPFIQTQIEASCPAEGPYIIAYEPIWAIGTGKAASPTDSENVHAFIKRLKGGATPVLYGGSVNSTNALSFLKQPSVDGLLVGGASLKRDEFGAILTCYV